MTRRLASRLLPAAALLAGIALALGARAVARSARWPGEPDRDRLEPNDALAEAVQLGPGRLEGLSCGPGDVDWFTVDVPGGQRLVVRAAPGAAGPGWLSLHRPATGQELARSRRGSFAEQVEHLARADERVAVRVFGPRPRYGLEVELVPAGDRLEPNGEPAAARPLALTAAGDLLTGEEPGLVCDGEDWFAVRVPGGRRLEARLSGAAPGLAVAVHEEQGALLAAGGPRAEAWVGACAERRLLVRVHGASGPYGLAVRLTPASDPFEPNDHPGEARPLPAGWTGCLAADGVDWYRLDPRGPGDELTVDVAGDLELALCAPDGALLAEGELLAPGVALEPAEGRLPGTDALSAPHPAGRSAGRRVTWVAREAGPVLVRVAGGRPGAPVPYALGVTATASDPFEPNDRPEQARPLRPGEHRDLRATPEDWYRLELAAGHTLRVELTRAPEEPDLDLELRDASGERLAVAADPGERELLEHTADRARTLLLRVHGGRARYALRVSEEGAGPFEPNDGPDAAAPVREGFHRGLRCNGEDWYTVSVPAGHVLVVDLGFERSRGDLDLELRDPGPEGALLAAGRTGGNTEHAELTCNQARPVAVRVHGGQVPYEMNVALRVAPRLSHQGGRSRAQAAPLLAGTYPRLHVYGQEWYRVPLGAGERLRVEASFHPFMGGLQLTLEDGRGRPLVAPEGGPDGQTLDYTAGARPEVVYLSVLGSTDYALVVQLLPGAPAARATALPPRDAYEPNDAQEQAAAIGPGEHHGLGCEGEDWYRVAVPEGAWLQARIAFPGEHGDLDLEARDAAGRLLAASRGTGDREEVLAAPAAGEGAVWLRVHGAAAPYELTLTPRAPDAHEPNDRPEAAAPLGPGRHEGLVCAGGADWYRVELWPGQRLTARLRFVHDAGDLDLELFAPGGRPLAASAGTGDEEAVSWQAREAGPVLVRVRGPVNAYALELELAGAGPPAPDRFEPNDAREQAAALEPGLHGGLRCSGEDWFRIEARRGDVLQAAVRHRRALGDLDLEVLDAAGALVARSAGPRDREGCAVRVGRGPVYLRVHGATGPYDLEVALRDDLPADRREPDQDPARAAPLAPGEHEGLTCTDPDWSSIALRAGQTVEVVLEHPHLEGDLDLWLYDAAGRELARSVGRGDEEVVRHRATVDGPLLVRVAGDGEAVNRYRLRVVVR